MGYEEMDDLGLTALAIFNKAIIETNTYIKDHRAVISGLDKTIELIRREKLKQCLDFANGTLEQLADDQFQGFDDQFKLGNIMGYIDDFYSELESMNSEQFELFWGFHNPETSENFWGNVESALNLGE